jgi:hypothetical protein
MKQMTEAKEVTTGINQLINAFNKHSQTITAAAFARWRPLSEGIYIPSFRYRCSFVTRWVQSRL